MAQSEKKLFSPKRLYQYSLSAKKNSWNICLWMISIGYLVALVKIVLFKYGFTTGIGSTNMVPFEFMKMFASTFRLEVALKNVLGNVAIFIPLGILVAYLLKKRKWLSFIICYAVSILFESIQYVFSCGAADIDDIILNTLGGAIGTILYLKLLRKLDSKIKKPVSTVAFLVLFGLCGYLSLYMYAPNMLPQNTVVVNKAVLGKVKEDKWDIDTIAFSLENNRIKTTTDFERISVAGGQDNNLSEDGEYLLAEDVRFIKKKMTYQYSPKGNIQKTTATFSEMTREEMELFLESKQPDGIITSLFFNWEEECETIIVLDW